MERFIWEGSESNKMLRTVWQRAIMKDPYITKSKVIEDLAKDELTILAKEGRHTGSAYLRLCYMDRAGLL
ncbi:hypothetical protein FHS15_005719 [Paenibacillus castaneae]|uniref:hypothetical protein n=1 Tax=Paenibacillus castaneae TaxID=474957 RepID=UPI00141B7C07|nr:hypothetical protein [Paenibacillus castaneae]NIK80529.1 hypothetical protein [Paenibacillus castaneae]